MICRLVGAALAAAAIIVSLPAAADKFPSRPITLISVFAPGGPSDIHMRVIAEQASKAFGVPVVVEPKLGGGGTLGPATMAATSKPDGYTVAYLGTGIFTVPLLQKVSFDPTKDFTYIISLSGYRIITAVRADSRFKSWADVVAEAKANPGKISYSTPGPGSATQLAFENAASPLGLKFLHVPFRGASEQTAAMLGGHVDLTPVGGSVFPLIDSGQARPILWLTEEPAATYPDVPGLKQIGVNPSIDPTFPYGLGGPKGMDPAIVKILHDGFKKASDSPENAAILKQLDQPNRYMNTADYNAFVTRQFPAYKAALEKLGLVKKD